MAGFPTYGSLAGWFFRFQNASRQSYPGVQKTEKQGKAHPELTGRAFRQPGTEDPVKLRRSDIPRRGYPGIDIAPPEL